MRISLDIFCLINYARNMRRRQINLSMEHEMGREMEHEMGREMPTVDEIAALMGGAKYMGIKIFIAFAAWGPFRFPAVRK